MPKRKERLNETYFERFFGFVSHGTYELTALYICGKIQRASVTIGLDQAESCFIPNTFTPKGDGKNEMFEIDAWLQNYALTVINRWGNRAYQNESYQNNRDGLEIASDLYC